jgi:hypothetical protein
LDTASRVKIERNETVSDLKEVIQEKIKFACENLDANRLNLWKASLPADNDLQNLDVQGLEKLQPLKKIGNVF